MRKKDPFHSEAKTIAKNLETKEIQAHTSVLTLVEVASVASRLYQIDSREVPVGKEQEERAKEEIAKRRTVFVIKTIQKLASLNVNFVQISGDVRFFVPEVETSVPAIFDEAFLVSFLIPLRTFDLMHVAAAKHAKQADGRLGALVTGDADFIRKKQELSKIIGMPILSPKEYVLAMGLS